MAEPGQELGGLLECPARRFLRSYAGIVPLSDVATRRRPGSRRAASAKLIGGSAGVWAPPGAEPRRASSNIAASSTVRVSPLSGEPLQGQLQHLRTAASTVIGADEVAADEQ
jgi:hypothetical protein